MPKEQFFQVPENGVMKPFSSIMTRVDKSPRLDIDDDNFAITAQVSHRGVERTLTIVTKDLPTKADTDPDAPELLFFPFYTGTSAMTRLVMGRSMFPTWRHKGIELFYKKNGNLHRPYNGAESAQVAYAMGMRAVRERVVKAHNLGRKIGVGGVSFGANVLSAYLASEYEKPDAVVEIEGGDMRKLAPKYRRNTDPRAFPLLEQDELLPSQNILSEMRDRTLTIVNPIDNISVGQELIWGEGDIRVHGTHVTGPYKSRHEIRARIAEHFSRLLR